MRARHLDARADLGRIERQQRFLGSMADRLTSRDVLLDPRALVRFLNAALDAVRADPGLTEKELVSLGTQLRHASGRDVRFRTVPIANPSYRAGAGRRRRAVGRRRGAQGSFTAMREDTAPAQHARQAAAARPTVPPDQVHVQVYNGCGDRRASGRAQRPTSPRPASSPPGPAQNWRTHGVRRTTLLRYDTALLREHQDARGGAARRPAGAGGRPRPHHAGGRRLVVRRCARRDRVCAVVGR